MGNISSSYFCLTPSPPRSTPQASKFPSELLSIPSSELYGNPPCNRTDCTDDLPPIEVFVRSELAEATKGFSWSERVGGGAFGHVYRGTLGGEMVAVKQSKPGTLQGTREWIMEVRMLEKIQHPNVVRLFGYCAEREELLLVYEFMIGGSVHDALFSEKNHISLSWQQRIVIALDGARGIQHLHSKNLMHRDMKAGNLLLDENLRAKLTDFGLARCGPLRGNVDVTTLVRGTNGYICPHYFRTGKAGLTVDIYAFGVLLLELITGKRSMLSNGQCLTHWVKSMSRKMPMDDDAFPRSSSLERTDVIIDEEFRPLSKQSKGIRRSMQSALWLADECVALIPNERPSAAQVVARLEEILKMCVENSKARCI